MVKGGQENMPGTTRTSIRQSTFDRIFDVINYGLLCIVLIIFIYPLLFVLSASISDPNAIWNGQVWLLPKDISFAGYNMIFGNENIWIGYKNTIIYAIVGTIINLFVTITAAYPLSRKDFYARNFLMRAYTFTMFFSGGMIPTYLLVKQLGMLDTIWAMIIPNAASVWNVIITRTYFQNNIPDELREAAAIDGCSNIKFLIRIVAPLSAPIIAVMTLFYGVGHWNAFFNGLIYLSDRNKFPLQLFLREILILSQMEQNMLEHVDPHEVSERMRIAETVKYGVIIVSSLPVLIVYPFVQRHFVKGIMIGSLKG